MSRHWRLQLPWSHATVFLFGVAWATTSGRNYNLLWCPVFIGADLGVERLLRVSELLWRVFRGSSCCQQPPEVRRSGRLVSLSSSLTVLLGHAAALLQRHQRLHRRDRGQDRLPRPAQEGQNKLTRFVSVRGNTIRCQTSWKNDVISGSSEEFQCPDVVFFFREITKSDVFLTVVIWKCSDFSILIISIDRWEYETKRNMNENLYFHQVVFARPRKSLLLTSCLCPSGRRLVLAHPPAGGPDHEGDPGAVPPVQEPPGVQRWGRPAGGLVQASGVEGWCDLRCDGGEGELEGDDRQ